MNEILGLGAQLVENRANYWSTSPVGKTSAANRLGTHVD